MRNGKSSDDGGRRAPAPTAALMTRRGGDRLPVGRVVRMRWMADRPAIRVMA